MDFVRPKIEYKWLIHDVNWVTSLLMSFMISGIGRAVSYYLIVWMEVTLEVDKIWLFPESIKNERRKFESESI